MGGRGKTAPWNGVSPPWASNCATGMAAVGLGLCYVVDLMLPLTGNHLSVSDNS